MGIAPIIELPVVSGRSLPLLSLPRFHGFGANESQPSCLLIFHASIIMLKFWVSFLTRLVVAAILIEAGDGGPGTVGTSLTSLGIETVGKRVLFGKDSTIALQVILANLASVHPQTETLIANELHDADGFVNSR